MDSITPSYKLVATFAIFWGYFSLGLLIASLGPSLLGFERQTGSSTKILSLLFTARSLGYLLGSILGGILLDKFPVHGNRILSTGLFVTFAATALIPFAGTVLFLGVLISSQGLTMGILDTIGNVLLLWLHGEAAAPWMQALHAVFAIGTLLSPLIVRGSMASAPSSETELELAYTIFSICAGSGGVAFAIIPTPSPSVNAKSEVTETGDSGYEVGISNSPATMKLLGGTEKWKVAALTASLLGLYVGAETGFGGFLVLFATRGAWKMTEAEGQFLTAVYWGCLAVGRILAIPISLVVTSTTQLVVDVAACLTGVLLLFAGFSLGGQTSSAFLWAGSAVYGLGMASVFPSAFMTAEGLTDLDGRAASVIMVGSATGEMIVPLVVGLVTVVWTPGFVVVVALATLAWSIAAVFLCAFETPPKAPLEISKAVQVIAVPTRESDWVWDEDIELREETHNPLSGNDLAAQVSLHTCLHDPDGEGSEY